MIGPQPTLVVRLSDGSDLKEPLSKFCDYPSCVAFKVVKLANFLCGRALPYTISNSQ